MIHSFVLALAPLFGALVVEPSTALSRSTNAREPSATLPVAVLECEVPALETFVVHGALPVPAGYRFDRDECPFTVYDGAGNALPTQWEAISYRADGSLMTCEILAVVRRGSRAVGSRHSFPVRPDPSSDPVLPVSVDREFVRDLVLRAEDVFGNRYEGQFRLVRFHRVGTAQVTALFTTRLQPLQPGVNGALEQLGAAQAWFSARAGTDVLEMALNFHNASSSHPSANLYFKELELVLPGSHSGVSMWPEPMAGAAYNEGSTRVLQLVAPLTGGKMHFMEQRHERGFRYFLHPRTGLGIQHAAVLKQRKGWARCVDVMSNGVRSWGFANPETPGYFPQALAMPDLDHVSDLGWRLQMRKDALWNQCAATQSVGPYDHLFMPSSYRNPYGVQYGGMTSGMDMNPYEGLETLWSGEADGLLEAYLALRCTNDRQPGAIYEDSGRSFDVADPRYLNADGTLPYRLYNNVFGTAWPNVVFDAPWDWHAADRSHEQYVASHNLQPPYYGVLASFDPIDNQHLFRYTRVAKMLAYLDNDPMARLYLQAAASLVRATYYEGPGGLLRGFLSQPAAIGSDFGREHAQAGDLAAAAYACGDEEWRASWKPWFEMYVDVLGHIQTPAGVWQASHQGKAATDPPLGNGQQASFRTLRPSEHNYTQHALRGVKEAVFADGVDTLRWSRARAMLRRGGRVLWTLLWKWRLDGSGPAGGGTWDRVAVGPIGPNPVMFVDHGDHPIEQFMPGLMLDSYWTGLGLTYWLAESEQTGETLAALRSYWESPDLRAAALGSGITNIWNNGPLIAYIQQNF